LGEFVRRKELWRKELNVNELFKERFPAEA
jgi:hypothetical protein